MVKFSIRETIFKLVLLLVLTLLLTELIYKDTLTALPEKEFNKALLFELDVVRKLPQCLIIGVRKAGTKALLTFLDAHSDVVVADREIHFFDREENYQQGLEWYRLQMRPSVRGQITLEKSPAYFHEERVPERVKHMNHSMRLLLIVSNPVRRAVSDYYQLYLLQTGKSSKPKTFEHSVLHPNGSINEDYDVVQRSIYVHNMQRWLRYFPREQIHIVDGDNLVKSPAEELQKVESFLGLKPYFHETSFYFNQTKGFYCLRKKTNNVCLGVNKGRQHPNVEAEVIQTLRQYFIPYNAKFYELVGHDFGWN